MRFWLQYAVAGAVLVGLVAGATMWFVAPADRKAVLFAAGVAYGVQLVAFGALVAVKDNAQLFMLGWVGGMIARFAAVGLVVLLVTRTGMLPQRVTLLSLIVFVFLLTILEPVFLRRVRATP